MENNICEPNPSNCTSYNVEERKCNYCSQNYLLDNNGNCIPMKEGCSSQNEDKCNKCISGYYLDNNKGICEPNPDGCNRYNVENNLCEECSSYYLTNNKCISCGLGCEKCNTDGKCKYCQFGYRLNKNSNECEKCLVENCDYCSTSGVNSCDQCINNFDFSYDEKKCLPEEEIENCHGGRYFNFKCFECHEGFYPSDDGKKCQKCMEGCNICFKEEICGNCNIGYKNVKGKCKLLNSTDDDENNTTTNTTEKNSPDFQASMKIFINDSTINNNSEPYYINPSYLSTNNELNYTVEINENKTRILRQLSKDYIQGENSLNLQITGEIKNFSEMFKNRDKITDFKIDLSNVPQVDSAKEMFTGCTNLKNVDLSKLSALNKSSKTGMFRGCSNLENVNIYIWNNNDNKEFEEIFEGC